MSKIISSSGVFSIHVDELKKILPRDEDIEPEEAMRRMSQYWNDRHGTTEKMDALFEKIRNQIKIDQKFTTEDLTFINNGVDILIDVYKNNVESIIVEESSI